MIHKILSIVALMLLLASCANDIDNSSRLQMRTGADNKLPVFYATIEGNDDAATKVFADEQLRVLWNADDRITVFNKYSYGYEYSFSGEDGDNAGEFAAVPNNSIVTGNPLSYVYAVYPHNSSTKISNDGVVTATLPAWQSYKANSFGISANTMLSVTDNTQLRFKNVGGYLSFKFYGDNVSIKSITLRSNSHEKLAGPAKISMTVGGTPTTEMQEGATESVTLTCETPVALGADAEHFTEFWFVLPPTTLATGFTVTVTDALGGVFEMASVKERTITRNKLIRLSPMEVKPIYNLVPPDNEIWYTTSDGKIIDLEASYPLYNNQPFNTPVVSHTYENGKGIIRCSEAITTLNDHVFSNGYFTSITNIYLPNSIIYLRTGALRGLHITELRLPDNLNFVGSCALNIPTLERFIGNNVSDDGRCVLFDECLAPNWGNTTQKLNGYLAAFAPAGLASYELPSETRIIGWYAFSWCPELKEIKFNEGLKSIMGEGCSRNSYDCDIYLPSTLESVGPYVFLDCNGIHGFYGNDKFFTPDHLCLLSSNGTYLELFVGEDVCDYVIPEGITGIQNYAFNNKQNLESVTLPSTIKSVGSEAFTHCNNLNALYGECTDSTHKALIFGTQFRRLVLSKGVTEYIVPDGITSLGEDSFSECQDLKEVVVSDSVTELGGYDFAWCYNLEKVVLSSNLERVNSYNPFLGSRNLKEIYFRSFIPPTYTDTQFYESDCQNLTVYVPEETLELYKDSGWSQYAPYMVGYHYDDIGEWNPDYYISTDYSADGQITTLQTATVGAGIDLILMGDAFSDRQIADGTYGNVMQKAMNAFFSEEPYKTMKNCFNVYQVNVVSATEGYGHSGQALGTGRGDGTYCYGNDTKVIEYARAAVGDTRMDDALVIVMMNEDAYAGTCFMYYPDSGDYGRGLSIAYFPTSSDTDTFNGLVSHEAGGHGFAKLADEYAYEYMGAISANDIANAKAMEPYGWWKNIDFTSDPAQVKWSRFIADARYDGQGLGCFEGGFTYWSGVWRPTDYSIMRYNTGGFNAPSREAIWYRIHKLAYGENWQYNYEDFVAYDAINLTVVNQAPKPDYVARQLPKPTPPVVVGHSWREALEQ